MCASRLDRDEVHSFVGVSAIKRFFDELRGQTVYFVGHNALSFDAIVLNNLCDARIPLSNVVDTLVLSYLYDPALENGHSLGAWGHRLKEPKGSFHDFSGYSELMDQYCQQDVKLGKKVFKALVTRMLRTGFSETSCQLEHDIRQVVDEQQENGWFFDVPGAQTLLSELQNVQSNLESDIRHTFPDRLEVQGTYNRRTKADGTDYATYLRHCKQYPEVRDNDDGTYSTLDWESFNIGSPKQRTTRLLEAGWEPKDFTPTGQPKVDEEALVNFSEASGIKEVQAIADWLVLQGRATMVAGWLDNVNYSDSRMHGRVLTCGATTRRMTHFAPNTANIPKAKAKIKYGVRCRQLWKATPGRILVGYDASGLENRMLAHYLNEPAATDLFLNGDSHMVATRALGFEDYMRDLTVKNGWYAMLYGAQDPKLGRTFQPHLSGKEAATFGAKARDILWKSIPGLGRLMLEIEAEFKQTGGLLRTVDGGFVRCYSKHAALNYKCQSAGAIVMKRTAVLVRQTLFERGLDAKLVGSIHDEGQLDTDPEVSDEVGKVCTNAITLAGQDLGFNLPIEGSFKSGPSWAETH